MIIKYCIISLKFTKDHKRRSLSNRNAVWSRPQLLLTNSFGQKKNRGRKRFQRKHKKVFHALPIQLPTPQSHHNPIPILPQPQRLKSTFVPFLHVGPWSSCKNENNNNKRLNRRYENKRSFNTTSAKVTSNENQMFGGVISKKHKRRKKGETNNVPDRGKREGGDLFIGLKKQLKSRNSWAPELPSDIEISFVATSVPEPQTGLQKRNVECRGQDGERLPFR